MKTFIIPPSPFFHHSHSYIVNRHRGAFAEQGSWKKFSILLASLRNLKLLKYSPFPWPCISKYGAQAGLALDGLNSTETIHHLLSYNIFLNKRTNKTVKSWKLHPNPAEMQAVCINGASNNVPCLKGKGPWLPFINGPLLSVLATKDTLQHTFNTSFVCHFCLCLPRETTATGAPRLILPPHQHVQQIISTTYSFGTCSHICWVGLVPDSPMKIDLLLKLKLQSSNTKEGTLKALHTYWHHSFSARAAPQIDN